MARGYFREKDKNRIELKPHDKFGYLEVIKLSDKRTKDGHILYECLCHGCNKITYVRAKDLIRGHNKSCGCMNGKYKEPVWYSKYINTKIYYTWSSMKQRCKNIKDYNYGGRGITYCERWEKFENFLLDMGEPPNNLYSLDRIDVNGNYCKENCRWATDYEQRNNTRRNHYLTYNGETHTLKEWSDMLHLNYSTLRARINSYHWDIEKALTTPIKKREI